MREGSKTLRPGRQGCRTTLSTTAARTARRQLNPRLSQASRSMARPGAACPAAGVDRLHRWSQRWWVLDGRVTQVLPFGAFVEVAEGIQGLLPKSAWSAQPVTGSRIAVRIASIDVENRRMSLVQA
jgi:polyribonucleotide nucleotidyltransferase